MFSKKRLDSLFQSNESKTKQKLKKSFFDVIAQCPIFNEQNFSIVLKFLEKGQKVSFQCFEKN